MAFSPFNVFRRNQKAIFAVVTVFIMFTFVLSSGLGGGADFFDWFPKQFGNRGDSFCTIDGSTVSERDVREKRFQRVMANRFMVLAAQQTSAVLRRDAQEKLINATPTIGNPARDMIEKRGNQLWPIISRMAHAPNANPNDRQLVMVVEAWMMMEQHQAVAEKSGGIYFTNVANKTARDVIDFMVWERKADKFGIEFTDDDVKKLVRQEFFDSFRNDVDIREYMSREYSSRFTPNALYRALACEFKVRAAQTAVLGPVSGTSERTATAAPIFTTPFDLFSHYRDKSSPAEYRGLAVPAASFATLVTETPPDRDVKRLYDERKDYEPDPSKEEFGFKDPRKVKIEWVAATGDEPYYKKAAADWITRTEQYAKGGVSSLIVPTPGVGPAAWASAATAPMSLTDPLVHAIYQAKTVRGHGGQVGVLWMRESPAGIRPGYLLETSYALWAKRADRTKDDNDKKRPVYAAGPELAALLTGLGTASVSGSPLLQPAAFQAQAVAHEARARGTVGGALLLSTVPGPGLLPQLAAAEAGFRQALPAPPSIESQRAELLSDLSNLKARDLAITDLKTLQVELVKLGNNGRPKDKGAAARAYSADFIKERGLKTGATPEGVSSWTVRDDAALAPLRESQKTPDAHGGVAMPFGQRFFTSIDPKRGGLVPATGEFLPEFYPERLDPGVLATKEPVYMAWRTEDLPARAVPFDDPKTKARVVEAWRRAKGRELARQAAEQAAARLRAQPDPVRAVMELSQVKGDLEAKFADPKAKAAVKELRLDNVAPIQVINDLTGMARPFTLAGMADLPFPTADMVKQLIDHRTDPLKTVLVLPDAAKDTYYVFVLTGRQDRGLEEFRQHLYANRGPVHDMVFASHANDSVARARESVMALLRKEFKYEETPAQKERLDERDKKGEE